MNTLESQAIARVFQHAAGAIIQPAATIEDDVAFLLHRAGMATGLRPTIIIARIMETLALSVPR